MKHKHLPVSDITFQEMIQNNFLYVDKTLYIYKLLEIFRYKCCILSRPRRFGKTLLLDTIGELFEGDRELFRGLWIDGSGYRFERYPVLRFTMTYTQVSSEDDIVANIKDDLIEAAQDEGVALSSGSCGDMLGELLEGIYKKHGVGAVVLVDEYDAPVTDHILDLDLSLAIQDVLKNFYMSMNSSIDYIHFAFVTGIMRFVMMFDGSGPDNFRDISLNPEFSGICGFTSTEMNMYFNDRFMKTLAGLKKMGKIGPDADVKKLKEFILEYYDGYSWLGSETVMNPYSILNFFFSQAKDDYWTLSGRPSCLSFLARERPLDFIQPCMGSYPVHELTKSDIVNLDAVPVLFHSGYLTVNSRTLLNRTANGKSETIDALTFRFPTEEVSSTYHGTVFNDVFWPEDTCLRNIQWILPNAIEQKDSGEVAQLLCHIFFSISKNEIRFDKRHVTSAHLSTCDQSDNAEQYCRGVLCGCLRSAGFHAWRGGDSWPDSDNIVLSLNDKFRAVILMKYCHPDILADQEANVGNSGVESACSSGSAGEMSLALDIVERQMRETDCAGPHRAAGCSVTCMAVAFRDSYQVEVRFFDC
ncbi:MAG: AAA family ATPase [Deltaproteobacteria bacterium]|jgi:hypothetical protein|nr:AAA family ATPase [Deltaproteobacteria bacterium]